MPNRGRGSGRNSQNPYSRGRGRNNFNERGGDGGKDEFAEFGVLDSDATGSSSYNRQPRPRRPPGLKGREIGLYYAALGKSKGPRGDREHPAIATTGFENSLEIDLSEAQQNEIASLLEQIKSDEFDNSSDVFNTFMEKYRENVQYNQQAIGCDFEAAMLKGDGVPGNNPQLNDILHEELLVKFESEHYNNMLTFRKKLPAFKRKSEILAVLQKHQIIVLSGETGCGKTTQIPQYILEDCILSGIGSTCNILCSQPRRISAISVAERIADERGERVGGRSIGYSIRLESRLPSRFGGTITFCTTGVILQYLSDDSLLSKVSHLIVDEVHERDVHTDFLLAIVKDLVKRRPELKVIIMSATLNANRFASYFYTSAILHIPGLTFPVKEYYLEDVIEKTRFQFNQPDISQKSDQPVYKFHVAKSRHRKDDDVFKQFITYHMKKLEKDKTYSNATIREIGKKESEEMNLDLIKATLVNICENDQGKGAVLIFVPGWEEISKLNTLLENSGNFPSSHFKIIPLHSLMPTMNQRDVFNRPPIGMRKIIISTNIAETSVTIDDVVFVIDAGRIKITNFDLEKNIETLDCEWVSHANAKQRKGRAGRVREGVCYHLFSRARLAVLEEFKKPEVLRKKLEEIVLQIKFLRLGSVRRFFSSLLDSPSSKAIDLALARLLQLHALDAEENLTPLGFHLAQLPMDPQTGKMILMGAIFSCVDPVFSIAAYLSFKDPFYMPLGKEKIVDRIRRNFSGESKSDHIAIVRAIEGYEKALLRNNAPDYCYKNFLSQGTLKMLHNMKLQFASHLQRMKFLSTSDIKNASVNLNSENIALIKGISCAGMYPNVAYVTQKSIRRGFPVIRTEEDGKVYIHPKSVNSDETNFESPFLIYHEKMKTRAINLYDTTMVSAFPLVFFGGKIDFISLKGFESLGVDGIMRFKCTQTVYNLVEGLRNQLDVMFHKKICHPGPTNWSEQSDEGKLLRTLKKVLTTEYRDVMNEIDVSSDNETDSD